MFIEDLDRKNDYIVINSKNKLPGFNCKTFDEFIEEAENEISLDGNLYCYIPDFDQENYNLTVDASDNLAQWFVFDKSEIPVWFKADTAIIFTSKNEPERRPAQAPVGKAPAKRSSPLQKKQESAEGNNQNYSSSDNSEIKAEQESIVKSLLENSAEDSVESGNKEAKTYVFGSSKGGTGKTFTCLITARRYARMHPSEKVAVADFDIIDGQVGISIRATQPTMMSYWKNYMAGDSTFRTMKEFSTKGDHFPPNIDFYLAPKDYYIKDKKFWISILENLIKNYDVVFFDTGIDYINYPPISYVYKIASRIVLTSTTSIKSVASVLKQIAKLKGISSSANANGVEVYSAKDDIGSKLRLAITGYSKKDRSNGVVIETFNKNIKILAVFGQYYSEISRAEYYGEWDIFDNNKEFNDHLDKLADMNE